MGNNKRYCTVLYTNIIVQRCVHHLDSWEYKRDGVDEEDRQACITVSFHNPAENHRLFQHGFRALSSVQYQVGQPSKCSLVTLLVHTWWDGLSGTWLVHNWWGSLLSGKVTWLFHTWWDDFQVSQISWCIHTWWDRLLYSMVTNYLACPHLVGWFTKWPHLSWFVHT
jgi:hypothetical protein